MRGRSHRQCKRSMGDQDLHSLGLGDCHRQGRHHGSTRIYVLSSKCHHNHHHHQGSAALFAVFVVTPGTFVSFHSRCVCVVMPTCLVGASSVSIVFRYLCERYGWCRDDSSTQSCVVPKTQEKAVDCKVASASELLPALDMGWVQMLVLWKL